MHYRNAESIKNAWWSSAPLTLRVQELVNESYLQSSHFWHSLLDLQKAIAPHHAKSVLNKHYDFYFDCILRHPEAHIAFSIIEEGGFSTSWTYKKLHRCVNYQLARWLKLKLKPHSLVAIVLPQGIDFLITLLAALRLGMTLCYLPQNSPFLSEVHLLSLLDQIKPDLIVTKNIESKCAQTTYPTLCIEELGENDDTSLPDPYAYPANHIMQLSLALHRKEPYTFLPLDAETTYLSALRDGLITLNLKPETTWIAPLSCPLRREPCSSLSGLLCGATLLHVSDEVILKDPSILKDKKPQIVCLSRQLLKLWSEHPACPGKQLKSFYISPLDRQFSFWKSFIQMNELEKTPCFQALEDNSLGGLALISTPLLATTDTYLKPSLGMPWSLKNLTGPSQASHTGIGFFTLALPCKANNQDTNYILSQLEDSCLMMGPNQPVREGVTLPLKKIEESLKLLPFVKSCLVHTFPKLGEIAHFQLTFLIFIDPLKSDISETIKKEWSQELKNQVSKHVGSAFTPDHIEYFSLIPKMQGSHIDRSWCINQYTKGLLSQKNRLQVYQMLNILRKLTQDAITQELL